jgi:hypothetical protein
MWWFLIGMFVQGATKAYYKQLVTRKALSIVNRNRQSRLMVVDNDRLIGIVDL